jgi:signal transduction histidine kinase/ActR/RegA family two-component response regulator
MSVLSRSIENDVRAEPASPTSISIRHRMTRALFLASGLVLALTSLAFSTEEYLTLGQSMTQQLEVLSRAVATNSTAALAFDNAEDATAVLGAFRANPHITAAALYDANGRLFARYPQAAPIDRFPAHPGVERFAFAGSELRGYQAVLGENKRLGTLYVRSDLEALYAQAKRYAWIVMVLLTISLPLAYVLSLQLQRQLLRPITRLSETTRAVAERQDYTVRAAPTGAYELDLFTDTFNQMLTQIQASERKLRDQLSRLSLLQRLTRATGERLDLQSVFQVVLGSLEQDLPIDFGCFLMLDPAGTALTVNGSGVAGRTFTAKLALADGQSVPIGANGLARCLGGELVYEPDALDVAHPFPQRLAAVGLRALVIAPLAVESQVFGVLVAARCSSAAFSSAECEFLKQLSEHVALATHQTRLYDHLQQAYDDLRQSQQTVLQQERLRALGQMASGIAHDINNAISPIAIYTESLLEHESQLSDRARRYLGTIQQAIEDVANTVARMREFYRERTPQLTLERVSLNRAVRQIVDLTRPRWSDLPQQRGLMIDLKMELVEGLPDIMGAENEVRDALTNLIFNAVDAMPSGGTLSLRTRRTQGSGEDYAVVVEVSDTGVGMDEETKRRCLEPFYTTKGERGTGLGLAMVYGMVQRHSADIEVESMPGVGTTVRLSFAAESNSQVKPAARPSSAAPMRRLRILLIDDDPVLIKSLQDFLQEDGHLVTAANGGQAGIEAFMAALGTPGSFELVITDLGMPYVDGRKVAATIKTASSSTPIVLLTGWGRRMIDENERPANVDKVLSKPPRLQDLRSAFLELVA